MTKLFLPCICIINNKPIFRKDIISLYCSSSAKEWAKIAHNTIHMVVQCDRAIKYYTKINTLHEIDYKCINRLSACMLRLYGYIKLLSPELLPSLFYTNLCETYDKWAESASEEELSKVIAKFENMRTIFKYKIKKPTNGN